MPRFAGEGHGAPAGVRGKAGRADMESAPTWGVYGGVNVPGFESPRCGGRERPPYGTGETRRPPGKMQSPRCTVGADSISARFAAVRGLREGHAPPLHGIRARPAKWACRGRPGERRAGCPHPAAPRGKAGFRGRDKSRPYGQILCSRQTGWPRCLPRFAGEGHGAPAGVRGKAGRADMESAPTWGVYGGAGFRGRDKSRPYE